MTSQKHNYTKVKQSKQFMPKVIGMPSQLVLRRARYKRDKTQCKVTEMLTSERDNVPSSQSVLPDYKAVHKAQDGWSTRTEDKPAQRKYFARPANLKNCQNISQAPPTPHSSPNPLDRLLPPRKELLPLFPLPSFPRMSTVTFLLTDQSQRTIFILSPPCPPSSQQTRFIQPLNLLILELLLLNALGQPSTSCWNILQPASAVPTDACMLWRGFASSRQRTSFLSYRF